MPISWHCRTVSPRPTSRACGRNGHRPSWSYFSGDLRLPTPEAYERWYGHEHKAKHLLGQAVFGLTEVYRDRIQGARLVANPGCYATSVMLPLVPLLRDGLIDESDIVADAKSGATGAGRSPREELLFCELADDFSASSRVTSTPTSARSRPCWPTPRARASS